MLDTYDLITRSYLQDFLGLSDTQAESYNPLLENIIQAVSDRFEKYCNTYFIARSLKEYYSRSGQNSIVLKYAPVISLDGVYLGRKSGITIRYTGATSVRANAVVSNNSTLTITNTPGTSTQFDLTSASYDTLAELVTGINLISGWTATAVSNGYTPSTDLVPQSVYCYGFSPSLAVVDNPIYDYELDHDAGIVYRTDRMQYYPPMTDFPIRVDYTAGWSTTKDGLPDDVKLACCQMCKRIFDKTRINAAVQSETIGRYSYTSLIAEVFKGEPELGFIREAIGHYKRNVII